MKKKGESPAGSESYADEMRLVNENKSVHGMGPHGRFEFIPWIS
jgi:hypothetical protein